MFGLQLFLSWRRKKGCFSCFIRDLKVDIDPKGRFVSFKFTPSNDRVLCVYAPSGYSTREQLDRGRFFEGLQNYMENKNKGNENKIILEDFNCIMDKMDRDGENKTQRLYWCCSSYVLSKLIVDNGLEDLWRRENQDCLKFTRYERSFCKNPGQTGSILIYKLLTIPRLITQWYPLLIIITLFLFFYGQTPLTNSEFSSATKISCFLLKTEKTTTLQCLVGKHQIQF